jgi:hypothetical protein
MLISANMGVVPKYAVDVGVDMVPVTRLVRSSLSWAAVDVL